MKFLCGKCGAKYRSSQDYSLDKPITYRCRKCETVIILHKDAAVQDGYFIAEPKVVKSDAEPETVVTSVSQKALGLTDDSNRPTLVDNQGGQLAKTRPAPPRNSIRQLSERERRDELQVQISKKARKFELLPLIRVLNSIGYSFDDIIWKSNRDSANANSIIESVDFSLSKQKLVSVCVTRGLLGADSLLPSYFHRLVNQMVDPEPFYEFIHFFEHGLIREFVLSIYPQLNQKVTGDWANLKASYLGMNGVSSISTLTWLFQLYFPELVVKVKRQNVSDSTDSYAFRTGTNTLDGTGIVGNMYAAQVQGFRITMLAQDERNDVGQLWPHVVRHRLHGHLASLLEKFRLHLTVELEIQQHETWASIQQSGFLGYDRIRGEAESGHTVLVHHGPLSSETANTSIV
ncbi:MAG: hypothetical protein VYC39_07045 [Myxococcota bacterium]|nr:hypothetical protein [Myxococcota bacterium]